MTSIGEKIRIRRLLKNYSQEYMAFMLEISQAAYSNLERDETELTIKRVYEIAEVLEVSPFELMPKPKFGSPFDHIGFVRIISKLKRFFPCRSRQKKQQYRIAAGDQSDI